jgi:hypothetical protein
MLQAEQSVADVLQSVHLVSQSVQLFPSMKDPLGQVE